MTFPYESKCKTSLLQEVSGTGHYLFQFRENIQSFYKILLCQAVVTSGRTEEVAGPKWMNPSLFHTQDNLNLWLQQERNGCQTPRMTPAQAPAGQLLVLREDARTGALPRT